MAQVSTSQDPSRGTTVRRSRKRRPSSRRNDSSYLAADLPLLAPMSKEQRVSRRRLLGALGTAAGAAVIGACGGSSAASPSDVASTTTTTTTPGTSSTSAACAVAASETQGPYPDQTGMVSSQAFYRQDVTEGRSGLPVMLAMTIVNAAAACAPISGANVEIWQCDAEGHYSEYAQPGYNGTG